MTLSTAPLAMPLTGLGTYQLRGDACVDAVATALDLGYRHIDTAQMYLNETEVGLAMHAAAVPRGEIFLTTKIWPTNFRASDFLAAFERSLNDLRSDYVDLLLLHWPQERVPLAETLGALSSLVASGKVRRGGVSNFSVAQLAQARALAGTAVSCTQFECHVGNAPLPLIKAARADGLAITAYSPLGRGALAGKGPLTAIAKRYGVSAAQVALRWLTQQGIAVIPKASSKARLAENLAAAQFDLHDDDMALLGRL